MTDRKLLELAAKAAGIKGEYHAFGIYQPAEANCYWNPLTDDGDALQLVVKLGMDLAIYLDEGGRSYANTKHLLGYGTDGSRSYQCHEYKMEAHERDPCASTRRAIVRAAASIGEQQCHT